MNKPRERNLLFRPREQAQTTTGRPQPSCLSHPNPSVSGVLCEISALSVNSGFPRRCEMDAILRQFGTPHCVQRSNQRHGSPQSTTKQPQRRFLRSDRMSPAVPRQRYSCCTVQGTAQPPFQDPITGLHNSLRALFRLLWPLWDCWCDAFVIRITVHRQKLSTNLWTDELSLYST